MIARRHTYNVWDRLSSVRRRTNMVLFPVSISANNTVSSDVTADLPSPHRVNTTEPIPYYSCMVCELNSAPYLNRSIYVCIAYGLRVRTELSSVQPFQLGAGFLEFSKIPRRVDITSPSPHRARTRRRT